MVVSNEDQAKVSLRAMDLMKDGIDGSGDISKTLKHNGIHDIMGIFTLTEDNIEHLEYNKGEGTSKLNIGQRNVMCIILSYNTCHIWTGVPLKIMEWIIITQE